MIAGDFSGDFLFRAAFNILDGADKAFYLSSMDTTPKNMSGPLPETIRQFAAIVGEQNVLQDPQDHESYVVEPRQLFRGKAALVLRPGSTQEVSDILKVADKHGISVIPQSGNTGLVGGQIPTNDGNQVIISSTRLDKVRSVDPVNNTMTVEAGVTLQKVQETAEEHGRLFPLSLASEGSCRIGGNLATNAGGVGVLAYGNTRELCLGLEVVLADGRIWNGLKRLRKNNTGYDLRNLFIGSEGTLGFITAAVLKLFPAPSDKSTAFVAIPDPAAALAILDVARRRSGGQVTAIELLPRIGIEFTVKHAGTRDPLAAPSPWYVLVELSGQSESGSLDETMQVILAECLENQMASDAVIATSSQKASELWRLREAMSEVQKHEGGSIKHDISVPVSSVPEFIERAIDETRDLIPGGRPVAFGHIGDGNIHYNIAQPVDADKEAFLARWPDSAKSVNAIIADLDGSISAEHGIGAMKRDKMVEIKSPLELELMQNIKSMLDPNGIMNPGKVLPR